MAAVFAEAWPSFLAELVSKTEANLRTRAMLGGLQASYHYLACPASFCRRAAPWTSSSSRRILGCLIPALYRLNLFSPSQACVGQGSRLLRHSPIRSALASNWLGDGSGRARAGTTMSNYLVRAIEDGRRTVHHLGSAANRHVIAVRGSEILR
jgi:hypothetical protein